MLKKIFLALAAMLLLSAPCAQAFDYTYYSYYIYYDNLCQQDQSAGSAWEQQYTADLQISTVYGQYSSLYGHIAYQQTTNGYCYGTWIFGAQHNVNLDFAYASVCNAMLPGNGYASGSFIFAYYSLLYQNLANQAYQKAQQYDSSANCSWANYYYYQYISN